MHPRPPQTEAGGSVSARARGHAAKGKPESARVESKSDRHSSSMPRSVSQSGGASKSSGFSSSREARLLSSPLKTAKSMTAKSVTANGVASLMSNALTSEDFDEARLTHRDRPDSDGPHQNAQDMSNYLDLGPPPDFKRRQLIFDSLMKITGNNFAANDRRLDASGESRGTYIFTMGAGYHGQLGRKFTRGQKKYSTLPQWVQLDQPIREVACGGLHSAAVTDSGSVYTWGDGRADQLGHLHEGFSNQQTPRLVDAMSAASSSSIVHVACGQSHTVALSNTGQLYSWGFAKFGQLGSGERQNVKIPRRVPANDETTGRALVFSDVSCGDKHTVAVTDSGKVYSMGCGEHGQLGHGDQSDQIKPTLIRALSGVSIKSVVCGSIHTAFLSTSGELYVCGFGEHLYANYGTNFFYTPVLIPFKDPVKQVACGQSHILALTVRGEVFAWGSGSYGQLGHGAASNLPSPRLVMHDKSIAQVAAGRYHSVALTDFGAVYTWGCGENGQLGHDSDENMLFPRLVESMLGAVVGQVACGEHHTALLTSTPWAKLSSDVATWLHLSQVEYEMKSKRLRRMHHGLFRKDLYALQEEMISYCEHYQESLQHVRAQEQAELAKDVKGIRRSVSLMAEIQRAAEDSDSGAGDDDEQKGPSLVRVSSPRQDPSCTALVPLNPVQPNPMVQYARRMSACTMGEPRISSGGHAAAAALAAMLQARKNNESTGSTRSNEETIAANNTEANNNNQLLLAAPPNVSGSSSNPSPVPAEALSANGGSDAEREAEPTDKAARVRHHRKFSHKGSLSVIDQQAGEDDAKNDGGRTFLTALDVDHSVPNKKRQETEVCVSSPIEQKGGKRSSNIRSPTLPRIRLPDAPTESSSPEPHAHSSSNQHTLPRISNPAAPSTDRPHSQSKALVEATDPNQQQSARASYLKESAQMVKRITKLVVENGSHGVKTTIQKLTNAVFAKRKERDQLRALVEEKTRGLEDLQKRISALNSDQNAARDSEEHLKRLEMKLDTVVIKISETEENKRNYELNIAHLKEEEFERYFELEALRKQCAENEELYKRMEQEKQQAMDKKERAEDELETFKSEIGAQKDFLSTHLDQFEGVVVTTVEHQKKRKEEKALIRTVQKQKVQSRLERLAAEVETTEYEAAQLAKQLSEKQDRLQYYQRRYQQITSATGLSNPDAIINKFFLKEEIRAQLQKDIEEKEAERRTLKMMLENCQQELIESKNNYSDGKWRDIDVLQEKFRKVRTLCTRRQVDCERALRKLAFFQEGILNLVQSLPGKPDDNIENQESAAHGRLSPEFIAHMLGMLESRLVHISELVKQKEAEAIRRAQLAEASSASKRSSVLAARGSVFAPKPPKSPEPPASKPPRTASSTSLRRASQAKMPGSSSQQSQLGHSESRHSALSYSESVLEPTVAQEAAEPAHHEPTQAPEVAEPQQTESIPDEEEQQEDSDSIAGSDPEPEAAEEPTQPAVESAAPTDPSPPVELTESSQPVAPPLELADPVEATAVTEAAGSTLPAVESVASVQTEAHEPTGSTPAPASSIEDPQPLYTASQGAEAESANAEPKEVEAADLYGTEPLISNPIEQKTAEAEVAEEKQYEDTFEVVEEEPVVKQGQVAAEAEPVEVESSPILTDSAAANVPAEELVVAQAEAETARAAEPENQVAEETAPVSDGDKLGSSPQVVESADRAEEPSAAPAADQVTPSDAPIKSDSSNEDTTLQALEVPVAAMQAAETESAISAAPSSTAGIEPAQITTSQSEAGSNSSSVDGPAVPKADSPADGGSPVGENMEVSAVTVKAADPGTGMLPEATVDS